MFNRVLAQGAIALAALSVVLPAKAGMVDEAITQFAAFDAQVQAANEQIEDYEMDAAKASLAEAQDGIAEYGDLMDSIHEASDNLAGTLGDAWEPAMTASANLSAKITDTLGRIDNGSADFPGLLSAADNAETAFNTASAFSREFRGKLFAFRVVTLADMRSLFDNGVRPHLEAARTALLARNRVEGELQLALVVDALNDLIQQANAATSMTVTLGDSVTEATQSVWPSFAVLMHDVEALQAAVGSNPTSALTTVAASQATADKEITDAINRMASIENQFILICDSGCR